MTDSCIGTSGGRSSQSNHGLVTTESGHERRAVGGLGLVGLVPPVGEARGVPGDLAVDVARVGVGQQLRLVVPGPLGGGPSPRRAEPVARTHSRLGQVGVPAVRIDLGQRHPLLGAGTVEQAQRDGLGARAEHREVGAATVVGGARGRAWPGQEGDGVSITAAPYPPPAGGHPRSAGSVPEGRPVARSGSSPLDCDRRGFVPASSAKPDRWRSSTSASPSECSTSARILWRDLSRLLRTRPWLAPPPSSCDDCCITIAYPVEGQAFGNADHGSG